jgi:hypothetical protein
VDQVLLGGILGGCGYAYKMGARRSGCGCVRVIAAPAGFASAETAQETIDRLQSRGYMVNIDRVGSAPLD